LLGGSSVQLYTFRAGDANDEALKQESEASEFVNETYKHCKPIAASGAGVGFLAISLAGSFNETEESENQASINEGVVSSRDAAMSNVATSFIEAIAQHRHCERENSKQ
jgi:catalase